MAVFDDMEQDKLRLYPHQVVWKDRLPIANKADAVVVPLDTGEPLRAECSHFLECVHTRTTPRTDAEEGLRVLTVLSQCQTALEESSADTAASESIPGNNNRAEHHGNGETKNGARIHGEADRASVDSSGDSIESNGNGSGSNVKPDYTVHSSAFIDDNVKIGTGTKIWHVSHIMQNSRIGADCNIGQNCVIGPNALIGDGVKIQNNVSVYEGVILEDDVFCGPSVVFTNVHNPRSEIKRMDELRPTLIKRGASLGANCTIVCGNTVGEYAFVAAGAVVTHDVQDFAMVAGVPAKQIGWMCRCGEKITWDGDVGTCTCGRTYRQDAGTIFDESGATPISLSSSPENHN